MVFPPTPKVEILSEGATTALANIEFVGESSSGHPNSGGFGTADGSFAVNGDTIVTRPTGTQVGDTLVAHILTRNSSIAHSGPTGWTKIVETTNGTLSSSLWWKTVTASESAAYRWTHNSTTVTGGRILAYRNLDPTTPVQNHAASTFPDEGTGVYLSLLPVPEITVPTGNWLAYFPAGFNAVGTGDVVPLEWESITLEPRRSLYKYAGIRGTTNGGVGTVLSAGAYDSNRDASTVRSQGLLIPDSRNDYAGTPDAAVFDMTTGFQLEIDFTRLVNKTQVPLISKWDPTGSNASWALVLNADDTLTLYWSTNGTAVSSQASTNTIGQFTDTNGRVTVQLRFLPISGANKHINFSAGQRFQGTYDQIDNLNPAGNTSIFNGTAPIRIGSAVSGFTNIGSVVVHAVKVTDLGGSLSSATETEISEVTFEGVTPGTTTIADSIGAFNWTVTNDARIAQRGVVPFGTEYDAAVIHALALNPVTTNVLGWNDVTTDVRGLGASEGQIVITRGRKNELQDRPRTSAIDLAVNNRIGTYTNDNPSSPFYRKLPVNTQLRVRVDDTEETYFTAPTPPTVRGVRTRYQDSGDDDRVWWPENEVGDLMLLFVQGDLNNNDPADTGWRPLTSLNYLARSVLDSSTTAAVWWRISEGNTNSTLLDGTDCVRTVVAIQNWDPDSTPLVVRDVYNFAAFADNQGDTISTIAVTPQGRNSLELRYISGDGVPFANDRVSKNCIWAPNNYEPLAIYDGFEQGVGTSFEGGILASRQIATPDTVPEQTFYAVSRDTNNNVELVGAFSNPIQSFVVSIAGIEDKSIRGVGEVADWPNRWDKTGEDVWAPIQASGILRRMNQGEKTARSPLEQAILRQRHVTGYWTLEDSVGTLVAPSSLPNGAGAKLQLCDAGAQPPVPGASRGVGMPLTTSRIVAEPGSSVGDAFAIGWNVELAIKIPENVAISTAVMDIQVVTSQDDTFELSISTDANGDLLLDMDSWPTENSGSVTQRASTTVYFQESFQLRFGVNAEAAGSADTHIYFNGERVDANTDLEDLQAFATRVTIIPRTALNGFTVAHLVVYDKPYPLPLHRAAFGYEGEKAGDRFQRLAQVFGVPTRTKGDLFTTQHMGPQLSGDFMNSLLPIEATDRGLLCETTTELGLCYRTVDSLSCQDAQFELDYTATHLQQPFTPTTDDQTLHNDVTASSPNAGSSRVIRDHGRGSIQSPPNGVGTYDRGTIATTAQGSGQLESIAGWILHIRTTEESRVEMAAAWLERDVFQDDPELISTIVNVEQGDRGTVINTPTFLPPGPYDFLIFGHTELINQMQWHIAWDTQPGAQYQAGVMGHGTFGRYDTSDSRVLDSFVAGTDTELLVATYQGPWWIDEPDHIAPQGGMRTFFAGSTWGRASTPDKPAFAITNLDVRFDVTGFAWANPGTLWSIIGQGQDNPGTGKSWGIGTWISPAQLRLAWSTNGSTELVQDSGVTPDADPDTGRLIGRITMDSDNGAGSRVVTFYESDSITGTWNSVASFTVAGTTSFFNSTEDLVVGGTFFDVAFPDSIFHEVMLMDDINGTAVANPKFYEQTPGTTSFTDAQGNVWTLDAGAEIVAGEPLQIQTFGAHLEVTDVTTPSIRAIASGTGNLVTTFTVNKPSGTVQGDLLIGIQASSGATTSTMTTPTGGATWEMLFSDDGPNNDDPMRVWWKVAGASEPASYTFNQASSRGLAWVVAIKDISEFQLEVAGSNGLPTGTNVYVATPSTSPTLPGIELRAAFIDPFVSPITWDSVAGFTNQGTIEVTDWISGNLRSRTIVAPGATGEIDFSQNESHDESTKHALTINIGAPQRFTVQQATLNGVNVTVPAGEEIKLLHPSTRFLTGGHFDD